MKKILISAAVMLFSVTAFAQADKYEQRYELLVSKLGPAGVGVETLLDNWEKADSTNSRMLLGRFNYLFTKAQSAQVVAKNKKKYLGMDPIVSFKDSTGTDMYYYQEIFYDDELYGQAMKIADKAIDIYPEKLDFRFLKANAYIAYEKESPDMAERYLLSLIDESTSRKVWLYGDAPADAAFFSESMIEYCYTFYSISSPGAMNAFLNISERMAQIDPKNPAFLNNIGTYYLIAKEDYKTALKYYNKVLKEYPDDYTAIKNCVLLARKQNNIKLEKKYLQLLAIHGTETEKMTSKARLQQLGK